MAEAVVDGLEVIQIDEQQGNSVVFAFGTLEPLFDPIAEQHAIGQVGQRIVERLVRELILEAFAVADVAGGEHQSADVDVVEQIAGDGLHGFQVPSRCRARYWMAAEMPGRTAA